MGYGILDTVEQTVAGFDLGRPVVFRYINREGRLTERIGVVVSPPYNQLDSPNLFIRLPEGNFKAFSPSKILGFRYTL